MKRAQLLSTAIFIAFSLAGQRSYPDCSDAFIVCSNAPVAIEILTEAGIVDEIKSAACHPEAFPKTNSIWFKWQIKSAGTLGFTLIPLDETDDLDFILYKMKAGMDNCLAMQEIRCMASGENRGEDNNTSSVGCTGATGLNAFAMDTNESSGCSETDNNFLSGLETKAEEVYALFVNNYYSSQGFLLEFSGTSEIKKAPPFCSDGTEPNTIGGQGDGIIINGAYPNPAATEVSISINSGKSFDDGRIQIINLHGNVLRSKKIRVVPGEQQVSVSLKDLPVGVYFLKTVLGDTHHLARFSKF